MRLPECTEGNLYRDVLAGVPGAVMLVVSVDSEVMMAEGTGPLRDPAAIEEILKATTALRATALTGAPAQHELVIAGFSVTARTTPTALPDGAPAVLVVARLLKEAGETERTLRLIIDNSPSVVSVKGLDHRYQMVNREFEDYFGVTENWVLGRTDEDFLAPLAAEERRVQDATILAGAPALQHEGVIVHDGRELVFLTTRFPLLDDDGAIVAVCEMSTDVTARRRDEARRAKRLESSALIHAALQHDRFVLHAQPIVDLATMRATQSELLIRMRSESDPGVLVAPGEFLPAAERFDLIHLIDEWVVDRAVELAGEGHVVEVNLSARTISDRARVKSIESVVLASGAAPQNLIFEITETAVAENLAAARDFAVAMREIGCAFALDDFGVGHGTFTYLQHLPVDYLKIDLQFVRHLLSDPASRDVVQAIVGVARQFGVKTIAEGVEDAATLARLRKMGVDYAQGYWTGRPAPLGALRSTIYQGEPDAQESR